MEVCQPCRSALRLKVHIWQDQPQHMGHLAAWQIASGAAACSTVLQVAAPEAAAYSQPVCSDHIEVPSAKFTCYSSFCICPVTHALSLLL